MLTAVDSLAPLLLFPLLLSTLFHSTIDQHLPLWAAIFPPQHFPHWTQCWAGLELSPEAGLVSVMVAGPRQGLAVLDAGPSQV